ncbi:MAG: GNAT family N-acetyltransferase, partial [Oscillospiraceae bacterium]
NEDVTKFANWQTHATLDETKKVIGGWVKQYTTKPGFYRWAVEIEETHKVIGSVYVMFSYNDVRLFDVDFCFAPQYEKSDFAVEALNAVSEFLFVKVGANRVQVRLDTKDTA